MTTSAEPVNARTLVAGAAGAVLYGILGVFSFGIPGTADVVLRPAVALVPFVGLRFGAVAGFLTGSLGNAIVDLVGGHGVLTDWNWSVANGLIGLFAGLLARYRPSSGLLHTELHVAVAVVAGLAFTVTDVVRGTAFSDWLTAAYLPAVAGTAVMSLLLVPLLDLAWRALVERSR
jgi:energy-coupling factor transport system substrate-specific component